MTKTKNDKKTTAGVALVDPIEDLAKDLLAMTDGEALPRLAASHDSVDYNYLEMGGILSRIQEEKWWAQWGFPSFNEFVTQTLAFKPRKALYLLTIYNDLVDCAVPWATIKDVSWSKLKEISSVLTKENAEEWAKKASELTILQLQEVVAKYKEGNLEKSGVEAEVSVTVSLAFKVHPDQKETILQAVDKAKQEASTDVPAVALEAICMHYLAGGKTKPQGLKATMKKAGYEEVLENFGSIWPDIDLEISLPSVQPAAQSVQVSDEI